VKQPLLLALAKKDLRMFCCVNCRGQARDTMLLPTPRNSHPPPPANINQQIYNCPHGHRGSCAGTDEVKPTSLSINGLPLALLPLTLRTFLNPASM
jgi:hypothetical protein